MTQVTIADLPTVHTFNVGATPTSAFVFGFEWYDDADLEVYVDGVLKTLTSDYTVASTGGSVLDDATIGGTVTLGSAVTNAKVVVRLAVKAVKASNFAPGQLDLQLLNTQISRIYSVLRVMQEQVDRTLQSAPGDAALVLPDATTRASKYLYFDSNGDPSVASAVTAGALAVTPFIETLLDDASASAARSTLGLLALATKDTVSASEIDNGAVTTAKIADDNVTLAKLAGGTAGKYIGFDASGDPAELGAIYEYVGQATAAAAAYVDITSTLLGTAGYDYILSLEGFVNDTAGVEYTMQLSENNLSSLVNTGYSLHLVYIGLSAIAGEVEVADGDTSWALVDPDAAWDLAVSAVYNAELTLKNLDGASGRTWFFGATAGMISAGDYRQSVVKGSRAAAGGGSGFNSARISVSAGTFSGTVKVFRRKKSAITA